MSNNASSTVATAQKEISDLIKKQRCAPILLRLAFHDAGTYDALSKTGGPNGSIRLPSEYNRDDNKGIKIAVDLCETVKRKCPQISYADLYQLAGIVAVAETGGPTIDFVPGRQDAIAPSPPDRLPVVQEGVNVNHASHLRDVFYRMGFNDREIVALSGAHTLGKAHVDRSGFEGAWTSDENKFDNSYFIELLNYEQAQKKKPTQPRTRLTLPTDEWLIKDKNFKKYVKFYAKDQAAFFNDYSVAHKKMSELGFKQFPEPNTKSNIKQGIIVISVLVIVIAVLAYHYEVMKKQIISN